MTGLMTEIKKHRIPVQNLVFYMTGAFLILGLKCYYRGAGCDSLRWILGPTARWVQLLSRIPFTYMPGTGYVNHSLRLLIAPSCSGVRFMIILFATLVFSFTPVIASSKTDGGSGPLRLPCRTFRMPDTVRPWARGFCWIAACGILSWLLTVFVNGLRIIAAIYLPPYLEAAGLMDGALTQDRLHTLIGVVIYFIALLTVYRLIGRLVQRRPERAFLPALLRKCAPPVFWYFAFTLGLPLLNRAGRGNAAEFTEFAALVLGCCAAILLPYLILLSLRRHR